MWTLQRSSNSSPPRKDSARTWFVERRAHGRRPATVEVIKRPAYICNPETVVILMLCEHVLDSVLGGVLDYCVQITQYWSWSNAMEPRNHPRRLQDCMMK